ncbi:MAG: glycosyltransferase [Candidatus Nanoarchaeia archaeon]|nr:glycosyltransferase [Candidatus Nanoarchaeia archaeon]
MKIAMFTDTFMPNINGIVTSVRNSSINLAKKGHKIYIFTVKPKDKKFITKLGKNIKIFYYNPINLINYPDFQLVLPRLADMITKIRQIKPDVIHIHTPSFLGWSALLISKMFKIPVVSTYHTLLPDFLKYLPIPNLDNSKTAKKLTWDYTKSFYNRCNLVTTPSIAMKEELRKNGIKKPIVFLSNGVDLNKFKFLKMKKSGNIILHVGRIGYEKNIDVLIKAFNEVLKINKDARLVIAGDGPYLEELKNLTKKLKINKKVKFLGRVNYDELPKLYCSSDVFVTASTVETEGIVILEAMACGLPIIGVNKLAIPTIVKNGKNGFVIEPGDYKNIAKYIIEILKNKEERDKFGKESIKVADKYSLNQVIKQLERIYKNLK